MEEDIERRTVQRRQQQTTGWLLNNTTQNHSQSASNSVSQSLPLHGCAQPRHGCLPLPSFCVFSATRHHKCITAPAFASWRQLPFLHRPLCVDIIPAAAVLPAEQCSMPRVVSSMHTSTCHTAFDDQRIQFCFRLYRDDNNTTMI